MKKPRAKFLSRQVASLLASTKGNVAVTFALTTLPLVLAVGATIDYTAANKVKAKLDAMADAAALSAVAKNVMDNTTDQAKEVAVNFFNSQAANLRQVRITSATANVTQTSTERTAVFDYTANFATSFMGIGGYATVPLKGSTTATSASIVYADFHLLLDNSPSMGIGATPDDVKIMQDNMKCAFACHDSTAKTDTYTKAKNLNVKTRIDTVRIAAQNLMLTARQAQTTSGQLRMGIYSFGPNEDSMGLTEVAPISPALAKVSTKAANLDLMWTSSGTHAPSTDFDMIFSQINAKIPNPGDGSSTDARQQYLFFVSDGLADAKYAKCDGVFYTDGRCYEPIKTSNCDALKKRGIKIAVLYTTYLPIDQNDYRNYIGKMNAGPWGPSPNSLLAKNMQACASPGLFFEVSPTDGISDAMKTLFLQIAKIAHISK